MSDTFIFDTHAHYYDEKFDGIRDEILSIMPKNNVGGIINCGVDIETSKISVSLAEKYPFCYAAAGIHPESVDNDTVLDKDSLVAILKSDKAVAVGEIGLDYYWDIEFMENQRRLFEQQLILANEISMPTIIHDREAHRLTLELIKKHQPRGVLHCFSGSVEMAEEIIKLGMYIGIGGVVTFKNARKICEVVKEIPIERILLETDAPYMAPEPFRGKINNSAYISQVAEKISEIKGIPYSKILEITTNNAKSLFGIK